MGNDKVRSILDEVKNYLDGLSDEEKADLHELRFIATKKDNNSTMTPVCFELVAAVPFTADEEIETRELAATHGD